MSLGDARTSPWKHNWCIFRLIVWFCVCNLSTLLKQRDVAPEPLVQIVTRLRCYNATLTEHVKQAILVTESETFFTVPYSRLLVRTQGLVTLGTRFFRRASKRGLVLLAPSLVMQEDFQNTVKHFQLQSLSSVFLGSQRNFFWTTSVTNAALANHFHTALDFFPVSRLKNQQNLTTKEGIRELAVIFGFEQSLLLKLFLSFGWGD